MKALPAVTPVNCSCEEAVRLVKESLLRGGLRVLETFDLRDARLGLADYLCPYHGQDECDCQMVVLLVYGEAMAPTALTLHGNGGQTWISVVDNTIEEATMVLHATIEHALREIPGRQGL